MLPAIAGCLAQRYSGAYRSLRVRVGRAGTRVAATGLGQVRQMAAASCGYQEHEVQPLLEFSDGVAETAVSMGAFIPRALRTSQRTRPGLRRWRAHVPDYKASSCTGRLPPDACRAGSAPSAAGPWRSVRVVYSRGDAAVCLPGPLGRVGDVRPGLLAV